MGRRPSRNANLPPRLRARHRGSKTYYFYDTGEKPRREIALGSDYPLAVRRWSELEIAAQPRHVEITTFRHVAERYQRDVIPKKAFRTQSDNLGELAQLYKFFDDPPAPLDKIKPLHVQQYLEFRKDAPVRATREKALLSHIWNKAREWGYTDLPNPCAGIRGTASARTVYIEDDVYAAVYEAANQPLRDAMDLAYLTGQRPADVLRMAETDLRDGFIEVEQDKTGKRLRIAVKGELKALLDRMTEAKKKHAVHSLALVCTENGRSLTASAMRQRLDHARQRAAKKKPEMAAAIAQLQFRDLRAKAGTDKAQSEGIHQAQRQLGHGSVTTTEIYVRNRRGDQVDPTR